MLLVPDQLSSTLRILSLVKKNMLPSFPKHLPLSQIVLLSTLPHLYVLVLGWRTILGLLHRGLISFLVQKLLSRKLFLSVLAKIKNGSLNFFSLPHICCSPTFKLLVKNSIWLVSKFWTWVNQNTSVYFSATALCTPSAASFLLITLNVACRVWWREGLWKHEWHLCWSLSQDVLAEQVVPEHHHHETKEGISKILPTWRNCHWLDAEQCGAVSEMLPGSSGPLLYLTDNYSYHMLPFFQGHQSISHSNWYCTHVPVAKPQCH